MRAESSRRLFHLALLAAAILLVPRAARADWHFTPFIGLTVHGDTSLVDLEDATSRVHWNFGGAVSIVGDSPFGIETIVVYTPRFFQRSDLALVTKSRTLAWMGNVVLSTPKRWNEYGLRPFVSGGLGLLRASVSDVIDFFPVRKNLLGYDVGGGAVGFLTNRTGLRFDVRYFSNLRPSDGTGIAFGRVHLSYWTTSIGVVIRR